MTDSNENLGSDAGIKKRRASIMGRGGVVQRGVRAWFQNERRLAEAFTRALTFLRMT